MDASFHFIPAHTRSYWKGIPYPHDTGHQDNEPNIRVDVKEEPNMGDEEHQEE